MILEADNNFYLQLSSPTGFESGMLFGNGISAIRSGVVFDAVGQLELRAGGNSTRLRVESNGDINVFSGEIQRTATDNTDLLPVCYGSVSSTGAINNGSSNISVTAVSTGVYEIAITDVTYSSLTHVAVATANNSNPRVVTTSTTGSNLVIRIFTITGTLVDNAFQFVVFEP